METSSAVKVFQALNGVFCVYKPPRLGFSAFTEYIRKQLARDLNELDTRPVSSRVVIDGKLSKGENLTVKTVINYADHPLVVGPRYQMKDFKLYAIHRLDWISSGVIPLGIGSSGSYTAIKIQRQNHVRTYELAGKLGFATDTFDISGDVREKSTYRHVTKPRMDNFLAKMESNHQSLMYNTVGVDLATQEAYEIASKGLLRPANLKTTPVIYSIKCLEFKPPNFIIEVQCVNEWAVYLKRMIHEIGVALKTNATCSGIRCTRWGKYSVDDSLLLQQVNIDNVLKMIEYWNPKQRTLTRPIIEDTIDDDVEMIEETEDQNEIPIEFKFEQDANGFQPDEDDADYLEEISR